MNTTLAILDSESTYLHKFTGRLTRIGNTGFDIHSFSDPHKYRDFISKHRVGVSLISEKDFSSVNPAKEANADTASADKKSSTSFASNAGSLMILDEGLANEDCLSLPHIDKYQAASKIMSQLLEIYSCDNANHQACSGAKRTGKLIAFIGNDCGFLHLIFSLSAASICAESSRSLYVNLYPFIPLNSYFPDGGGTISDILYYLHSESSNMPLRISSKVTHIGNLDALMPAADPQDIKDLTYEDMEKLTEIMGRGNLYRNIFFDIGPVTDRLFDTLELFDLVFVPVNEDMVSKHFFTALSSYLEAKSAGSSSKLREVILPSYDSSFTPFNNGHSKCAELAANELRKAGLI